MPENVPVLTTGELPVNSYTSRPVSINAVQWDGTEEQARLLCDWADSYRGRGSACYISGQAPIEMGYVDNEGKPIELERPAHIVIGTLEGNMKLREGDWLIQGTEDEFYPCKDSVFQRKYSAGAGDTSNLIIPPDMRRQLEESFGGPIEVRPRSLDMTMVEASPITLTGTTKPGVEIRTIVLVTKADNDG